ncbi:unnamed protein product [Pieris macdunnoughi]|uniref:Uncharacterized protein n=1 Tax=Pieris macdunnoughi TaxID=345717 RepID=A0A821QIQ7_9NEOP|nr:unnamed protein product [Pieris macdunnoughi]
MMPAGPYPLLPLPFSLVRTWIRQRSAELQQQRWSHGAACRQSKVALPAVNPQLLNLNRTNLKIMIGTITGHCLLNKHLFILGATDSPCAEAVSAQRKQSPT